MAQKREPLSLTTDQVAYELQMNPQVVRRWLRSGKIPGQKFGREWRVSRETLERLLRGEEFRTEGQRSG